MFTIFRIHTASNENREDVTWLELFFDLVYVAILVELGARLSANMTLQGVLQFAFLFVAVWWSWLSLVFFTRLFPTDDLGQRLLTVAYMAVLILMAFEIHGVTGGTAAGFLVAYALTKFLMAAIYLKAWLQYPEYRPLTIANAIAFVINGLLWLLIARLDPTGFLWWALLLTLDVLAPAILRLIRRLFHRPAFARPPVKYHYLLHRFGELTIIVLGEFFIKVITGASGHELTRSNYFLGICLLLISVSLWWLYFDHLAHTQLGADKVRRGPWMYAHYFLLLGIAAYGVVGYKVFGAAIDTPLEDSHRLLLCTALTLALLALAAIEFVSPEAHGARARSPSIWPAVISAAALLALGSLGSGLAAGPLVALVAGIWVAQVVFDVYRRTRDGSEAELAGIA